VRGLGLLVGIEFRDASMAHRFVAATLARGVIINWTLNADNVVRLAPPLTIGSDEIDFALNAMKKALDEIRA
jgi:4-aminobutyrate aminotransferase-like enzyme